MSLIRLTFFSFFITYSFTQYFNVNAQEIKSPKTTYIIAGTKSGGQNSIEVPDTVVVQNNYIRKYTNNQYKWIDKYCFSVTEYDWNDPEVNLHLDKTLKYRKQANTTAGLGVASAVLGLCINGMAQLVYAMNEDPDKTQPRTFVLPYIASGGLFILSGIHSSKKKKELIKLKQARETYKNTR